MQFKHEVYSNIDYKKLFKNTKFANYLVDCQIKSEESNQPEDDGMMPHINEDESDVSDDSSEDEIIDKKTKKSISKKKKQSVEKTPKSYPKIKIDLNEEPISPKDKKCTKSPEKFQDPVIKKP